MLYRASLLKKRMEITVKRFLVLTIVLMLATGTIASNPAALATTITSTIGTTTLSTNTTTFPVSTVSQTSTSAVSTISQTSTSAVSTVSQPSTSAVSTISETSTSAVSTVSQTSTSPVSTVSLTSTLTTTVTNPNTATNTVTATASACDPFNPTDCTTNTVTGTTTVTATATATATGTTTFPVSTVSQTSTSAVSTISQTSTSAVSTVSQPSTSAVSTISETSTSAVSTISETSTSAVSTVSTTSESVTTLTSTTVTAVPIAEIDEDYRCTNVDFSTVQGLICPIPQDIDGNFLVNAVLSGKNKNIASSTNPGQLYKVFRIDGGLDTFDSLSFTGTLPKDWQVNPNKAPGGVSVLFVPSGSDPITITGGVLSQTGSVITITQGTSSAPHVCHLSTQGSVDVDISDITALAGQPLGPGDVIYIWVKMQYGLKGQIVDTSEYACISGDVGDVDLYPDDEFGGTLVPVGTSGNLKVSAK